MCVREGSVSMLQRRCEEEEFMRPFHARVSNGNSAGNRRRNEGGSAVNRRAKVLCAAVTVFAACWQCLAGTPGTSFTYQGELRQGSDLASGEHDLVFTLWDALAAGSQIGAAVAVNDVAVTNGRFTVELDFGANAFTGDPRWLQISVDGAVLTPRQAVTHAPYALQTRGIFANQTLSFVGIGRTGALSASEVFGIHSPTTDNYGGMYVQTAGQNGWPFYGYAAGPTPDMWHYFEGNTGRWHIYNGGAIRFTVENDGDVGVGVSAPLSRLHVRNGAAGASPHFNSSAAFERDTTNYISILSPNASERGILFGDPESVVNGGIIYNSAVTPDGFQFRTGNNQTRMVVTGAGNVGIGTASPFSRLHVAGPIYSEGNMILHAFSGDGATGTAYFSAGDTTVTSSVGLMLRTKSLATFRENMYLSPSGAVGIGTMGPVFTLHVNGDAGKPGGGSWSNTSDVRLKKNIETLDGALDALLALRGVTFEYIDPDAIGEPSGQRIGMIAQEVERVFPDWVAERADGYKSVTYRGFEALTVEAMRELHEANEVLRAENDELRARLEALERAVDRLADIQLEKQR